MIKKFNQAFSAILAACVILTSVPVNALSTGETNTEQQTLNDLNTENSISTNESNATSAEVVTDSDASEDTSISEISSNDIDSSEEKLNNEISLQSDDTEDEEEPSTDNWELGLVFYDSSVDNGKTPLTSIDWDASDGGYGTGTPRVITVQINYKNTNAVTTYQPGELKLKIDGLLKGISTNGETGSSARLSNFTLSWVIGANDATHTGYDWNYAANYTYPAFSSTPLNISDITFTNANIIEEKSNFEGSIQMVYTVTPRYESGAYKDIGSSRSYGEMEACEDECIRTFSKTLKATLEIENKLESNDIVFNYQRNNIHPWKKLTYKVTKSANKITSYDNFPDDAESYIWVKYHFTDRNEGSSTYGYRIYSYPYICAENRVLKDVLPSDCVVYDSNFQKLEPDENNKYTFTYSYNASSESNRYCNVYVGYPKSIYNEENGNMNITNTVEMWGTYYKETDESKLSEASVSINLADFEFNYSGNLYGVDKTSLSSLRYQDIIKEYSYNTARWALYPSAYYTGTPMTLKVGDDLLYITDKDNNYVRLNDDEYYFSHIKFNNSRFTNGNNDVIEANKYDCELWVKYKDSENYILYEEFKNSLKSWTFKQEDGVVGFYFIIHNLKESVTEPRGYIYDTYAPVEAKTTILKKDINESGSVFNFDYLQVFFHDNEGNLILQNEPERNSYASYITQEIADYDQETYNTYMQRACAESKWSYYETKQPSVSHKAYKSSGAITQDVNNEMFYGSFNIGNQLQPSSSNNYSDSSHRDTFLNYFEDIDSRYAIQGFKVYDLLPEGMELISSKEEIAKSNYFSRSSLVGNIYDIDGEMISLSDLKSNTESEVKITNNWRNTNRTRIEIISTFKKPIYIAKNCSNSNEYINCLYTYNYAVSYDSFLEYGAVWENECYTDILNTQEMNAYISNSKVDEMDIDEDGDNTNKLGNAKATATITSVVSTHQDVTKYVQTDKSNYSTGTVKASPDSEYTYKLRIRTGQNDITNLVIYDSVEEYAQDKDGNIVPAYGAKKHWNGEFLGVDTSYAENKGYKVKVYYSEDKQAGSLSEDNSWREYSEAVDKTKVKSLAFEYLNKDDETQKAVLPANSQTYVLVKMKAPPEENRKILAYNGCRTQWQALDEYDRPVDFITGINSNVVKVSLSDYYDITVNKIWDDENNKYELRPDSIDIILKKDGIEIERKQITEENLSVTFTDLLVEDSDRYTIEEAPLFLYSSSIEYDELDDCYEITNTLKEDVFTDISGTKIWVEDKESNRPESITIKLLKDGEVYRTTTTNADKEWKYSFDKVPIYNADETRCIYSVEEIPIEKYTTQYTNGNGTDNRNGLAIKFNSQCRTESANYDYVEIYYKQDGQSFKLGKWGGTDLAGKTVNVPTNDFYLYWRTDSSQCSYYGFSIDSIESAEVSATGTVATLPNYTATELTGTDYPESPNHGNYGNNLNMLWHYTGTLSSDVPAEGLFNIVNTYEGVDSVNISFIKGIEGTDEAFEKLQLKRDDLYKFQVSMKNRETGDTISVQIDNKNTVTVREVPIGTYVITEKDDMYFDFVSMEALNSVEGVTFEKVGNDYILTITDAASDEETLQIKVNNKIEPDRPYEDKEEKENLFKYPSSEEEPSLLSRIANFFKN